MTWTRLAAAGLWIAYLLAIAGGDGWSNLVVPWVRWSGLAAALALLAIAGLAARGGLAPARLTWPDGWSFSVAGLPLLLLLRAGTPAMGIPGADLPAPAPAPPSDAGSAAPAPGPAAEDGPPLVRLDRLAEQPGTGLRVLGMAVTPVGRLSYMMPLAFRHLPDPLILVRFRIVCCAADGEPLTVPVRGAGAAGLADLEDGTWVEVRGRMGTGKDAGILEAEAWKRCAAPDPPYIQRPGLFGGAGE